MSSLLGAVDSSARTSASAATSLLPNPAIPLIDVCVKIHGWWRWNRLWKDVTRSEETAMAGVLGWGVNQYIGQNLVGELYRIPAQLILINVRYHDCLEEYKRLSELYNQGLGVCAGERTYHIRSEAFQVGNFAFITSFLDPSSQQWLVVQFRLLVIRVERATQYIFLFIQQVFTLSNCLWSLSEALSLDEATGQEAKNLIFLNVGKMLTRMATEPEVSNVNLEKQKAPLKQFLGKINSPYLTKVDESFSKIEGLITNAAQSAAPAMRVVTSEPVQAAYVEVKNTVKVLVGGLIHAVAGHTPQYFSPPLSSKRMVNRSVTPMQQGLPTLPTTKKHVIRQPSTLKELKLKAIKKIENSKWKMTSKCTTKDLSRTQINRIPIQNLA